MKTVLTQAAWIGLAVSAGSLPVAAQLQDNSERQMTCDNNNGGYDSDGARHCEIREQTVAAMGRMNVDSAHNGAVTVKGWLRGDELIRSRIESRGESDGAARNIANQVSISASAGQVRAMGPETAGHDSWSVSYEIFVPQTTDLTLQSHNGAISISDVRGQIHFEANNGAVRLKRLAGDVSGSTVNGAIQVDLAGGVWEGRQLEVSAKNGAVAIALPAHYSAHIQAETGNGRIQSDFPVTMTGNPNPHALDFNVGSGGPLIHVTTGNGSVRLQRAAAQ